MGGSGADGGGAACVPGVQIACACPGSGSGIQVCNAQGTAFGQCTSCTSTSPPNGGGCGCVVAADGAPAGGPAAALVTLLLLGRLRRRSGW